MADRLFFTGKESITKLWLSNQFTQGCTTPTNKDFWVKKKKEQNETKQKRSLSIMSNLQDRVPSERAL